MKNTIVLQAGGVIVAPSDTIYGLLGIATNQNAIKKIQTIKKRDRKKPMPVLVVDLKQAKKIGKFSSKSLQLAKQLWPGPYTLVVQAKAERGTVFPRAGIVAYDGSVGIRVPRDRWLQDLLAEIKKPLVATSANRSGQREIKNIKQAQKEFAGSRIQPDLFVDGGTISRTSSNVIDIRTWPPKVLRGSFKIRNSHRKAERDIN